jgi:hypothetical protein
MKNLIDMQGCPSSLYYISITVREDILRNNKIRYWEVITF